jgi:hypothetical protein
MALINIAAKKSVYNKRNNYDLFETSAGSKEVECQFISINRYDNLLDDNIPYSRCIHFIDTWLNFVIAENHFYLFECIVMKYRNS